MTQIQFVTGHLGDGKSLYLVMQAFLNYFKGNVILCNFDLNLPIRSFKLSVPQLIEIVDRLNPDRHYSLFIDEAHTETGVEGREAMSSSNKEFSYFVSQMRKRNIDLYYVSQWNTGAEYRLRMLTDYIIKCHCIRDYNNENEMTNAIGFLYRKYDVIEEEQIGKWFMPSILARYYYPLYQTAQIFKKAVIH